METSMTDNAGAPTCSSCRMDSDLPKRDMARRESDEPTCRNAKTARELPRRDKARRDTERPVRTSRSDKERPICA
eukprot:CAMPEP_0175794484 /NCGR_PEP_ID=MMETSP0097-20121207/83990_2 /TAXON_ID=311494 /ORGANISM="Alexandrium monilatum, Strain CCMP3105" /LENGTH=74 /DNA_ID=CAMNT_0017105673 /DNA_START=20 /DNA_END=240 /DNA_ORIENTATION=-